MNQSDDYNPRPSGHHRTHRLRVYVPPNLTEEGWRHCHRGNCAGLCAFDSSKWSRSVLPSGHRASLPAAARRSLQRSPASFIASSIEQSVLAAAVREGPPPPQQRADVPLAPGISGVSLCNRAQRLPLRPGEDFLQRTRDSSDDSSYCHHVSFSSASRRSSLPRRIAFVNDCFLRLSRFIHIRFMEC